ncbi:MAG: glutathione S-transferase family protein [Gluconacetobacter diazotrophicus]|nr:glutathione S-transferase family protein [Gluconacetobacter diazotrophicus]
MTLLYWGPHTCAIGIHVLLEEIGAPYRTEKLDVAGGDTEKPPFQAINPKGKVPTVVRDDGSVLTEFGPIARWLAHSFPEAGLSPADPETGLRAEEMLDYAVGTVHAQGFGRIFKTETFLPADLLHGTAGLGTSKVRQQGREMVEQGFAILADALGSRPYAGGDRLGYADGALFYVERWAPQQDIPLPPPLAAHLARMKERPAVRRVLEIWGES